MNLIKELKTTGEDFEFYPTTDEILEVVRENLPSNTYDSRKPFTLLDIGAGNGKSLSFLNKKQPDRDSRYSGCNFSKLLAIEKSQTLISRLPEDVQVIGTDFMEQSLFDKEANVTFCNPPYSQFKEWVVKILSESKSKDIFLVIPQRWENSPEIKTAISNRGASVEVLGEFSFLHSEDRKARATVHLLHVKIPRDSSDPFVLFIEGNFPKPKDSPCPDEVREEEERMELLSGANLIDKMISGYNAENDRIRKSFEAIQKVDYEVLRDLGVDASELASILLSKLEGLKGIYWAEVFSELGSLTERFTTKNRNNFRTELIDQNHIDFTKENIIAVVGYLVRKSNSYINSQITDVWESMGDLCNIQLYKSNKRTFGDDEWKFRDEFREGTTGGLALDLRVVVHRCGGIYIPWSSSYKGFDSHGDNGLDGRALDFLSDLLTVAYSLGWKDCDVLSEKAKVARLENQKDSIAEAVEEFTTGKTREFSGTFDGNREVVFSVKAFKNKNIHIKFSKKFLCRLNVEYGKIKGWLLNGEQAVRELDDSQALEFFDRPIALNLGDSLKALSYSPED